MVYPTPLEEDTAGVGIIRCLGCGGWVDVLSPAYITYGCVTCSLLAIRAVRDRLNRW